MKIRDEVFLKGRGREIAGMTDKKNVSPYPRADLGATAFIKIPELKIGALEVEKGVSLFFSQLYLPSLARVAGKSWFEGFHYQAACGRFITSCIYFGAKRAYFLFK